MTIYDIRGTTVGSAALAVKAPCLVATTGANITLSGVQAVDGVTVGNNSERVLVKDQVDETTNGIYIAQASLWLLAADFGNNNNVIGGMLVTVFAGAINALTEFVLTCPDTPIVIGTSLLTFQVFARSGSSASVQGQRSIISTAQLPIVSSDSILNVNAGTPLTIAVPAANTRPGGALLTFKILPASAAVTLTLTDGADGQTSIPMVGGMEVTLRPYVDGVNSGYAI